MRIAGKGDPSSTFGFVKGEVALGPHRPDLRLEINFSVRINCRKPRHGFSHRPRQPLSEPEGGPWPDWPIRRLHYRGDAGVSFRRRFVKRQEEPKYLFNGPPDQRGR